MPHQTTKAFDAFLLRACVSVLLLRLLLTNLLPDDYIYIKDRLADMVVAGAIFVLFLVFTIKKSKDKTNPFQSNFNLPIWLLLLACWSSLIHSADFSQSLYFVIPLTAYVLFFYLLVDVLKTPQSLRTFWSYFIPCIIVVIIFAFWEYFVLTNPDLPTPKSFGPLLYKRIGSLFQLPNVLAGFLMLSIPFIWTSIILTKQSLKRRLLIALLVATLLTFLMTLSFLCTLNFLITTALLSPLFLKEWFKKDINKNVFLIILLSIVAFFILIISIRPDLSFTARWEYLTTAFKLLKDNPWTGWGINTFDIVNRQYVNYTLGYSAYVHNSYLQLWIEAGFLAVVAIVLLIITFIKNARQALARVHDSNQRMILVATIWALSNFFIDNLTNFTMLRPSIALFWWSSLAIFSVLSYPGESVSKSTGKNRSGKFAILVVGLVVLLSVVVSLLLSMINYRQGMLSLMRNDLTAAETFFKQSEKLNPTDFYCASASGFVNIRQYLATRNIEYLAPATKNFERATRLSPYSDRSYEILSNIALEQGDQIKAKEYHLKAVSLSAYAYHFKERFKNNNAINSSK